MNCAVSFFREIVFPMYLRRTEGPSEMRMNGGTPRHSQIRAPDTEEYKSVKYRHKALSVWSEMSRFAYPLFAVGTNFICL